MDELTTMEILWTLLWLDIKIAFLNDDLLEEVHMDLPLGYAIRGKNFVYKLNRFIYGFRQPSWQWFQKFSSTITTNEFQNLGLISHCFTLEVVIYFMTLLVHVDDIKIPVKILMLLLKCKQLHSSSSSWRFWVIWNIS